MQQTCRNPWCKQPFDVTEAHSAFYDKISPVFSGKKEPLSPPTLCPECRQKRRLAFRNERSLYYRTCDLTGKNIISMYRPDSPFTVYEKNEWFSDKWDAMTHGCDFDFSRPFFEQFAALMRAVPRMSLVQQGTMENSEFCNRASNDKNCYLLTSANYDEDCYYSSAINDCKNCVDCYDVQRCELCYECHDTFDCYRSAWLEECHSCSDSFFLKNCVSCRNCLYCTGLHQKQYCIFNQQYSKEKYEKQFQQTKLTSAKVIEGLKKKFQEVKDRMIVKEYFGMQNESSTGNYLDHCKNAQCCFESRELEDCTYLQTVLYAKDCMDFCHWGRGVELVYESHGCGYNGLRLLFVNESWDNISDLLYCDECMHAKNLFGCCGLRHKEYCIFNKQYSKEEYEKLVPRIIAHMRKTGEWGEFFPATLSPFVYNETIAQDYFPLSEKEASKQGWQWLFEDPPQKKAGSSETIPDDVQEVTDEVTEHVLHCSITGKTFKIIPQELKFYREMGIPVPRKCPDQRHKERMALRNPRKLWKRECAKCKKEIQTTYAPERLEIVYCEECYLKEVY